jgi:hypothetical protein
MASAKITLRKFIAHAIDREYMSGVSREKSRVKATGEVFTPDALVREMLDKIQQQNPDAFTNRQKTFCDPSAGDGQFLAHVMLYKLVAGDLSKMKDPKFLDKDMTVDYHTALKTVYGVDLMPDNVKEIKNRLGMGYAGFKKTLAKNIVCANALTYDFSFDGK